VPPAVARRAEAAAWAVAGKAGVDRIGAAALASLLDHGTRTVYRFDVRSPEDYIAGHLAGFRSAPGGQLVQETDRFAPVRGALVVLAGDGGGRAAMTASWLAQMGWEVAVLETGPDGVGAGPDGVGQARTGRTQARTGWGQARTGGAQSRTGFEAGHVPGAAWALRTDLSEPGLADRLGRPDRLVLTSADGMLARFAAADAPAGIEVLVLAGGTTGWARSGRPLESGPAATLSPVIDVYRRPYEGTGVDPVAMQAYLDSEYGLVGQLERDGTHGFRVLR
jgi:rhodanese-related sulfurtransferase